MPNSLDANGLQVATVAEITASLQGSWRTIYGADANVNANSPDGQVIGIIAENSSQILQLLSQVYNSFDPDNAFGVTLDSRVAMNGIQRKAGSYTVTYVQVTVDDAVTLLGRSELTGNPATIVFSVQDNAGNLFELIDTYSFGAAGTVTLAFRSSAIGQVEIVANTIQTVATPQTGVTAVNNPNFSLTTTGTVASGFPTVSSIPSTVGMTPGMLFNGANFPANTPILTVDSLTHITLTTNATGSASGEAITISTPPSVIGLPEETDPQLKIRRGNSFALQAVSPADALRAALLNIADVADAFVVENDTNGTVNSVPAHSIEVIVNGGTDAEIAQVIYAKKAPGCGMYGSVTHNVTRPQGSAFTAKWNVAVSQPLYIRATLNPRIAGQTFDVTADGLALADALIFKLGQSPSIGDVVQAMFVIEPLAVLSTVNVSTDGITWADIVSPTTAVNYFLATAAHITLTNA